MERKRRALMKIGDKVSIDGMAGTVVAIISEGQFSPAYPADAWAYLKVGVLVDTIEAGLIHISDIRRISAEPNSK